jgi:hypothetical protein
MAIARVAAFGAFPDMRRRPAPMARAAFDPQETLDVHCGNGFDAGFSPCFTI